MLVVVGTPAWDPGLPAHPAGTACRVALAAAGDGAAVELVGRLGDDPAGDALLIALAAAGVGHVAVLRDPARPTRVHAVEPDPDEPEAIVDPDGRMDATAQQWPVLEPADVALGLSYVPDFTVLVVAEDVPADVVPVCVEAARFRGAQLVVLLPNGGRVPEALPADATVLEAPADATAFADVVARYAAALDRGEAAATAFSSAVAADWTRPIA